MSSSEAKRNVQATPWALDEFASNDIFPASPSTPIGADADYADEHGIVNHAARLAEQQAQLEANAYARGVADGERIAREDAEHRVASLLNALAESLESIRLHEARWISNAEENVAALAVGVARHVVQREIVTDPSAVQALVQRAIGQFPLDQALTVRLNPEDHAVCASIGEGRPHQILWAPDANIVRGGCLVEGRERIIDGRVDTALERLYRTIGQVQS